MLNAKQRVKVIERGYGRKTVGPRYVYRYVSAAVRRKHPVSVIRLGDVMAKLLARRNVRSLYYVSRFLGVKLPPSKKLQRDLEQAVKGANIVGVSHYKVSITYLRAFMARSGWKPPRIADSFLNDQLYEKGYLHRLIRENRVALVGRASPDAARQLKRRGLKVVLTVGMDGYGEVNSVIRKLKRNKSRIDLVLVGASVPGRILCTKLKQQAGLSAIEIGHMMDALSKPGDWAKPGSRKRFKHRWMRKLSK
ncbi:GT-D fold domain-containing glycosyltransferase [Paenibacillus sp. GD4]|uniref:GT-D fold domain-containing protein n=1 Tax=Paenibacillus sp. GD4 TaxID=3068890 RepID=UPI002796BE10|nr:GT-D fold domain-containing glycosyltransferase [Paenibacillus sp. GD4]MDQ1909146.1 GT-D fold domain-containing glycosyltransferase [Paenibacillus sp. GD4]